MAKLVKDSAEVEAPLNESLTDAGEELEVPFGCTEGFCGTCFITIEEGAQLLSPLTPEEKDQGCDGETRLCCQMRIVQDGTVRIKT